MIKYTDFIDAGSLRERIDQGYISDRVHPEFPKLHILNYTDKCQYDQVWDNTTRNCRGLIINAETHEVIARGMPKWFNLGHEGYAPDLSPDDRVDAYTKWDGSLGILYRRPDGEWAIATRGSFESEQANKAMDMMPDLAATAVPGRTLVFEIIYPENRIVVDYGDLEVLQPLGFVDNLTGDFTPHPDTRALSGPLRDVLATKYDGDEGFILRTNSGEILKYKHSEYLELHRVVSHLTEKEVWRQLRAGTFEAFSASLPDEFHRWANDVADELRDVFWEIKVHACGHHFNLEQTGHDTRKEQALWIQENVEPQYRGLVFSVLDGRDISDSVWKMVEPRG